MSKPGHYSTQGGDFNTNYTSKVGIVLPELYATKIVMQTFHVDDLYGNNRHNIILGRDIWSKLKIYLCL